MQVLTVAHLEEFESLNAVDGLPGETFLTPSITDYREYIFLTFKFE
jgi:hypothetical protein